jgi:segregation and condensation protein B
MRTELKRTVEALLFAADESLSIERIQSIVPDSDRRAVREVLDALRGDYDQEGHAFQLSEIAGGWRIQTRPEHSEQIEALLKSQRRVRLTRPALEVLAVVAYRQPCARSDVEAVRGVNCGGALATLLERGLLRITGRAETLGRPLLYGTTDEFLAFLGINRIEDLPRLAEIESLLAGDGDGEETAQAAAERRAGLEDGRERIAEIIGELALQAAAGAPPVPPEDSAESEEAQAAADIEDAAMMADLEDADALTPAEHARILQAGFEEERASLEAEPTLEGEEEEKVLPQPVGEASASDPA